MGRLISPRAWAANVFAKPICVQPEQDDFRCEAVLSSGKKAGALCLAQAKMVVFVYDSGERRDRPYALCGRHCAAESVEVED